MQQQSSDLLKLLLSHLNAAHSYRNMCQQGYHLLFYLHLSVPPTTSSLDGFLYQTKLYAHKIGTFLLL